MNSLLKKKCRNAKGPLFFTPIATPWPRDRLSGGAPSVFYNHAIFRTKVGWGLNKKHHQKNLNFNYLLSGFFLI